MGEVVRVAILSDTHGELDRRIAKDIEACDYVVHAGDLGSSAVAELMRPITGIRVIVRGNNDVAAKWTDTEHAFLDALPTEAELELPGGRVQIVHGDRAGSVSRRHHWLRSRYPGARAVVYGHSHRLDVDTTKRPWILNPGAAGVARTFGGPSFIILSASDNLWRVKSVRYELPGQKSFVETRFRGKR